jgi:hypothetical protein
MASARFNRAGFCSHAEAVAKSASGAAAATECDAISIEPAQSGLALDVLDALADKTIILGVLDLSTHEVGDAREGGRAHPPRSRTPGPRGSWPPPRAA